MFGAGQIAHSELIKAFCCLLLLVHAITVILLSRCFLSVGGEVSTSPVFTDSVYLFIFDLLLVKCNCKVDCIRDVHIIQL